MILLIFLTDPTTSSSNTKNKAVIQEVVDVKDWKKLIKSKTNVLMLFGNGKSSLSQGIGGILQETAELIKGIGTVAVADCSG